MGQTSHMVLITCTFLCFLQYLLLFFLIIMLRRNSTRPQITANATWNDVVDLKTMTRRPSASDGDILRSNQQLMGNGISDLLESLLSGGVCYQDKPSKDVTGFEFGVQSLDNERDQQCLFAGNKRARDDGDGMAIFDWDSALKRRERKRHIIPEFITISPCSRSDEMLQSQSGVTSIQS